MENKKINIFDENWLEPTENGSRFKKDFFSLPGLHNVIKMIRIMNNYTQQEFADLLEVNRSTYSRYETGERHLPLEVLNMLLIKFNLKITISEKSDQDIMKAENNRLQVIYNKYGTEELIKELDK